MTALMGVGPGPLDDPRAGARWDRWVRATATSGPLPLRVLCEAQLGFERWWEGVDVRLPEGLSGRLAQRLLVASVAVGLGGMAASVNVHATGRALVLDAHGAAVARPWAVPAPEPAPVAVAPSAPAPAAEGPPVPKAPAPQRIAPPFPPVVDPEPEEAAPPPPPVVPARRGALPVGKGMWIWRSERAEGGDPRAIVHRARAMGFTHLYVRTASLREGFYAAGFLNRLLPSAHAAGLRVYAWDFPYLHNVAGDVERALQAIRHVTPDGHRVDGYVADIELRSMGVNIFSHTAQAFGAGLRRAVGPNYPLIACVPRPSPQIVHYPFADVVASFDAVAPMVYWMHRDPVSDIAGAFRDLARFGKPIIPVGQAYDARSEGGPPGVPPRDQLLRFMKAGEELGASGVSWWSWQHADQQAWDAIRDAGHFQLPAAPPEALSAGQVRAYQTLLTSLGFPVPVTGVWDGPTTAGVQAYQQAARLPVTGVVDEATRAILFTPFAPPIEPQP